MSSTVLDMSMSLDGFIAGPNERPDNGLGDGGEPLHEWVFPGAEGVGFEAVAARRRGVNRQIYDEFMSTGAVIAGRGIALGGRRADHRLPSAHLPDDVWCRGGCEGRQRSRIASAWAPIGRGLGARGRSPRRRDCERCKPAEKARTPHSISAPGTSCARAERRRTGHVSGACSVSLTGAGPVAWQSGGVGPCGRRIR